MTAAHSRLRVALCTLLILLAAPTASRADWSEPVPVDTLDNLANFGPSAGTAVFLQASSDGQLTAAWVGEDNGPYVSGVGTQQVWTADRSPLGQWTARAVSGRIESDGFFGPQPDAEGGMHLGWTGENSFRDNVKQGYAARRGANGAWSTTRLWDDVDDHPYAQSGLHTAADGGEQFMGDTRDCTYTYDEWNSATGDCSINRHILGRVGGGEFTETGVLPGYGPKHFADFNYTASTYAFLVDSSRTAGHQGTLVSNCVAESIPAPQSWGTHCELTAITRGPGGSWHSDVLTDTPMPQDPSQRSWWGPTTGRLSVGPDGTALVGYTDGGTPTLAVRSGAAGAWQTLTPPSARAFAQVAVDGRGHVYGIDPGQLESDRPALPPALHEWAPCDGWHQPLALDWSLSDSSAKLVADATGNVAVLYNDAHSWPQDRCESDGDGETCFDYPDAPAGYQPVSAAGSRMLAIMRPAGADWSEPQTLAAAVSPDAVAIAPTGGTLTVLSRVCDTSGGLEPGPSFSRMQATATSTCTWREQQGTFGVAPTLVLTPVPLSNTATAGFSFSGPDGTEGFECELVAATAAHSRAKARCDDGTVSYTGLADDDYTFGVRIVAGGEPAHEVTSYAFTVDTRAPESVISSAPPAQTSATTADFAFTADEAGVLFECRLDAEPFRACESPKRYVALGLGDHDLTVRATDAAGNVEAPGASRSFTVVQGATPNPDPEPQPGPNPGPVDGPVITLEPDDVPAGGACTLPARRAAARAAFQARMAACPMPTPPACAAPAKGNVRFAAINVVAMPGNCFKRVKGDPTAWETTGGAVKVNGLLLTPKAGGKVVVDPGDFSVKMPAATLDLELGTAQLGAFTWTSRAAAPKLFLPKPLGEAKLGGLTVAGSLEAALSAEDDGSVKVTVELGLPDYFTPYPVPKVKPGKSVEQSITAGFTLSASNEKGLNLSGRMALSNIAVKGFELSEMSLGFDSSNGSVQGSGTLVLAHDHLSIKSPPTVSVDAAISVRGGVSLSVATQAMNKPVGYGFFLQRVGFGFDFISSPPSASGKVGASLGPRISIPNLWEGELISVDGSAKLLFDKTWKYELNGTGAMVNQKLADLTARFDPSKGQALITFDASATVFGYGLTYSMKDAEVSRAKGFAGEGHGLFKLPGVAPKKADMMVGGKGIVVCYGEKGKQAGKVLVYAFKAWITDPTCDLGRWRATVNARAAARAAAVAPRTVTLPGNLPVTQFAATGATAPPKVVLTDPKGNVITTPADETGIDDGAVTLYQDPQARTTFVTIDSPAGGAWRFDVAAGSEPIAQLRHAEGLPQPKVRATVSGRGAKRSLRFTARAIDGQRLTFYEEGAFGARQLTSTDKSRGAFAFRPAGGVGGARRITVAVTQDGHTRANLTAGRYTAPAQRPVGTPGRVIVKRTGSRVSVSWRRVSGAVRYSLYVKLSDGRRRSYTVTRNAVVLTGVSARVTGAVTVRAASADRRQGRTATAKLTAPKRKPVVKKRR